jgi:hypothetical protein
MSLTSELTLMNESDFKERTERLLELNEVIKKLDVAIRQEAFALLQDYVLGNASNSGQSRMSVMSAQDSSEGREAFFSKFSHEKPAENALLISAYHFSQFGSLPFTLDEIKTMAGEVGVTIPERADMTFLSAKRAGKNLFLRAGRGGFRPTVHGEAFFKKDYSVSKGKSQKPAN